MTETIVTFDKVTKKYYRTPALKNVSIQISRGKVVGLIGPNGSGKTTMLKLMSGLILPTAGKVSVNNRAVDRRISSEVAYLSEMDIFYSFFTVEDMIKYYHAMYQDFDLEKSREILAFMELESQKRVKELSKGNRGRLKIVLTLARNVPLLLMDEPLSGLDPIVRESIIKGLLSYVDIGKQTLIMTTHEVSEIEPLLDSVIGVKDGEIRGVAEVEDIRSECNKNLVDWMKETL